MAVTVNGLNGLTFNNGSTQNVGALGVQQTWQSVFFSRGFGVTYTNTTGKPIMVAITATVLNTSTWFAYVDGTLIIYNNGSGATSNAPVTGTFIVPNGSTYSANYSGGLSTIAQWVELR